MESPAKVAKLEKASVSSVQMQSRLYEHEHPLLNPMLVVKILQYANPNFTNLQNIRLVCKLWHSLSLPKWRSTAVLTLHREVDIFASRPTKGLPPSQFLHHLVNPSDPLNLQTFPFTRYKFRDITIDMGQHASSPLLGRFWKQVGRHMKYLHLERCSIVKSVPLPVEKLVLERTPNLEELVMSSCVGSFGYLENCAEQMDLRTLVYGPVKHHKKIKKITLSGKSLPFRLPELLRCFKNLEVLKLEGFQDEPRLMDSLFETLYTFRMNSKQKHFNIKELSLLVSHFTDNLNDQLILFRQLKLPLEILRVQIPASNDQSVFRKMLDKHAKNLQVLEIFCPPTEEKFSKEPIFNKPMPSLKELRLWGNVVDNLNFLEYMPNLQVLKINLHCLEKWSEVEWQMKRLSVETVKTLTKNIVQQTKFENENFATKVEQFYLDVELEEQSLSKLAKWMPNLKTLETVISGNNLNQIGEEWSKLENLRCLLGSKISNDVIIGTNMNMEETGMGIMSGISQFRCLKSFRMDDFCGKAKLSDESVYRAFLDMPCLENLHLSISEKMTTQGETALRNSIRNTTVVRSCETAGMYHKRNCIYCKYENIIVSNNINFKFENTKIDS